MITFLRVLGLIWSLPVSLVGAAVALFCAPRGLRWRARGNWGGWVVEVAVRRLPFGKLAAMTFGHVQLYRRSSVRVRAHEDVHTFQGDLLGPLSVVYFLLSGALLVYWLIRTRSMYHAVWLAYLDNPLEVWARLWARSPSRPV